MVERCAKLLTNNLALRQITERCARLLGARALKGFFYRTTWAFTILLQRQGHIYFQIIIYDPMRTRFTFRPKLTVSTNMLYNSYDILRN